MTLEEKKSYVLKYVRLGMDPLSSMICAECNESEIASLEADKGFSQYCKVLAKLEEASALEDFQRIRKSTAQNDDSRDTRWYLSKINPQRWGEGQKSLAASAKGQISMTIDFGDASEANALADNVEISGDDLPDRDDM